MFSIDPVSPVIGAEISGLRLADDLDDETVAKLGAVLLEYKALVFRDQHDLTPEKQVALGRRFGELEVHPFAPHREGLPEVLVVHHDADRPGAEDVWHSDVTFRAEPSAGSILRAVELPPVGGDTLWACMEAAYDGLSGATQRLLEGLTASHTWENRFKVAPDRLEAMRELYPTVEHPVVRTHPITGRKAIYVNRIFTTYIVGMKERESTTLLELLFDQANVPAYQCRFRWRPGSVVMWDNRTTQHYAVNDYYPATRIVERVTLAGDKPS